MNALTTLLYWISTGMMIPVIILVLISFGWSLLLLGDLYGGFTARLRCRKQIQELLKTTANQSIHTMPIKDLKGKGALQSYLLEMKKCDWHPVHGEKVLADFELAAKNDLKSPTLLMRTGPMLGLMGTLIPMGPALAGLASGDISSMATNMQVAFSTTVIGVFIGGVGFVVQLMKSQWSQVDYATLSYLFELSQEQKDEKKTEAHLCA